ncbi:MAG: hypothetical protein PVJ21_23250, partial [Anaerolineales bacterium]
MKLQKTLTFVIVLLALILAACGPAATEEPAAPTEAPAPTEEPMEEPTEAPAEEPTEAPMEEPMGLSCDEPVKVGLITDLSGALAIYGAHILPAFMLGMEYATGAAGSAGDVFD